jgi:hypothetical protein
LEVGRIEPRGLWRKSFGSKISALKTELVPDISTTIAKNTIKAVFRIRDDFPDPSFSFPDPVSKRHRIPGFESATKNLSIFNPKICY